MSDGPRGSPPGRGNPPQRALVRHEHKVHNLTDPPAHLGIVIVAMGRHGRGNQTGSIKTKIKRHE